MIRVDHRDAQLGVLLIKTSNLSSAYSTLYRDKGEPYIRVTGRHFLRARRPSGASYCPEVEVFHQVEDFFNLGYNSTMSSEAAVLQTAGGILEQMLETPVRVKGRPAGRRHELDGELVFEGVSFLVEVKSDARSASVARAIEQLKSYQAHDAQADLLLIVPQMTETGAELCKRARINGWTSTATPRSVTIDLWQKFAACGMSSHLISSIGAVSILSAQKLALLSKSC